MREARVYALTLPSPDINISHSYHWSMLPRTSVSQHISDEGCSRLRMYIVMSCIPHSAMGFVILLSCAVVALLFSLLGNDLNCYPGLFLSMRSLGISFLCLEFLILFMISLQPSFLRHEFLPRSNFNIIPFLTPCFF